MAQKSVNPDLQKERSTCTFDPKELTYLLDGGKHKTEERKSREKFFLDDERLKDTVPNHFLSHKEKYEEAVRKSCIIFTKVQELQNEGKSGMETFREVLGGSLGTAILKDGNPFALHFVMFIPTIMGQGDMEQQSEWIQRAWNCEILGTYAQTELGHGTFIRGLETTATYDPAKEEFVIHSPTLTSYKWWPGGLGHTANYAIVLAQLYTQGKCHGIHPFIVQLRDEETHQPMPGIKIGEIGAKLGMNATNNGYLGFEQVRIPRKHMLMKNNKVLKDGSYVQSPSDKLTYGTMMFVRVVIVQDAAHYLRKAVTIATRYSAVRHQSQIRPDQPEPQIIDFVTQQYKIFPFIATYFAFQYSASWIWDVFNNVSSELETGKLDSLPELHAAACCLKAVCSADAAQAVETCRLACGGHGYMAQSNLPSTYGLVTAMCTYEGENTVMLLQTARYLIKSWQIRDKLQHLHTVNYLGFNLEDKKPFVRSVDWIIHALQLTAAKKIQLANQEINEKVKKGLVHEDAWNGTSIRLAAAAEAHGRVLIVKTFHESVKNLKTPISKELRTVLVHLVELYAVYIALKVSGDLLRFTDITGNNLEVLQSWLEQLLNLIRPNAIGIVDGFDIHDDVLGSALGVYDGNVYEKLFEEATKSPLNAEPVNKSFKLYLQPFLKSNI